MSSRALQRISIVVPLCDEAEVIDRFYARLCTAVNEVANAAFEIICVDDGSTDDTLDRLVALTGQDRRLRVIELTRNFGKEAALSAGIDASTGDVVILIDADSQDPPELIPCLVTKWRDGADVVLARRVVRPSNFRWKQIINEFCYSLHNRLSSIRLPGNIGDFRLMNRAAVEAFKQLPERNRFVQGLFAWVGFRTVIVDYIRDPRTSGRSKFSPWRRWNMALEGLTSFSTAPLRLWTYLGAVGALSATIYGLITIFRALVHRIDVPGYASLLVVILFVASLQLIGIGVLGEYVGRIYLEAKQRPRYIVRAMRSAGRGTPSTSLDPVASSANVIGRAASSDATISSVGLTAISLRLAVRARSIGCAIRKACGRHELFFGALIIAVVAFTYNRWLLDPRTFFFADDWEWLWQAEFLPWNPDYFPLLPMHIYNDRPVGVAAIRVLYQVFHLNHGAFQKTFLWVHVVNCWLLYVLARRYITTAGSLLAALLSAVWFSADSAIGWSAAIFDVLGSTLCLLSLLMRQRAIQRGQAIPYDIAGVALYFLAIRTKEFALGALVPFFLLTLVLEGQRWRSTITQLAPYTAVFVVLAGRYLLLQQAVPLTPNDPYNLHISIPTALASLAKYLSFLFYVESEQDRMVLAGAMVVLGVGALLSDQRVQRTVLFGIVGFVVMLGPTLFLRANQSPLYLYAPHFFMALAIGALINTRRWFIALGATLTAAVVVPPIWVHTRQHVINYYQVDGAVDRAELDAAIKLLQPLAPHTTVVIAGVQPIRNPFWRGPGYSLAVSLKDRTLNVVVEKPEQQLRSEFCGAPAPKRFLRFSDTIGADITQQVLKDCSRSS